MRKARLQEVAAAAGVSYITAWRALNSPGQVSEKTIARVKQAVEDTGYVPDAVARSMVSKTTGVIGVIVPTLVDSIFADTVQGVADTLHEVNFELLAGFSNYDLDREAEVIRAFLGRRIDGLIVTGRSHTPVAQQLLERAAIPIVEVWDIGQSAIDMQVGFSNFDLGRTVTEYLYKKGYRRIAFASVGNRNRSIMRLQGYQSALEALALDNMPEWIMYIGPALSGGAQALDQYMAQKQAPDAIFFDGDTLAIGAHLRGLQSGLRYPDDVALIGNHDLEITCHVRPQLSSVRIPRYAMGTQAAELLLQRLAGEKPEQDKIDVGFELIERDTS